MSLKRNKDTRNGSGEQEMEELQKNLYPQICNPHSQGTAWLSMAEGIARTVQGCL